MHVNVRIEPRWTFSEVRRAALALSREIERRAPTLATSKWWKEERHGVFLDYNQNAKDRTTCSAYSVRPLPDARVSAPLAWDEVPDCEPADFTVSRCRSASRRSAIRTPAWTTRPARSTPLLELAARDEAAGLGDAPWPPHYRKMEGEAPRVAPSRRKGSARRAGGPAPRRTGSARRRAPPSRRAAPRGRGERGGVPRKATGEASAPRREDLRELVRRHDLELLEGAVARRLVRAPAPELRRVPKARALHVVVRDLDDELRPQRLPRQILALTPAALRARLPLRAASGSLGLGPRRHG